MNSVIEQNNVILLLWHHIYANLYKLILRKCDKDDSPHWSRCFTVISFIFVALLASAIVVWSIWTFEDISLFLKYKNSETWSNIGVWIALVIFNVAGF